jgi:hypothetical protein
MMRIVPQIKEKTIVDEQTIEIGKGTEKVSKVETQKMIAQRMDSMSKNDPARAVYDKIYKGVKQFT